MKWWLDNVCEFERFKKELSEFDELSYEIGAQGIVIKGTWAVFGKEKLIRRYQIELIVSDDFPNTPPKVFETGGEIPRQPDYHINGTDQSACIFAEPERFERWPLGSGIRDFLNGPLREYFFSQAYYALSGSWPFDEWSHGDEGICEYFAFKLKCGDLAAIKKFANYAASEASTTFMTCPCGSKKDFVFCHAGDVKNLMNFIPAKTFLTSIQSIDALLEKGIYRVKIRNARNAATP